MECRVFENFQKKYFEIPKMPKSVPKSIQTGVRVIFSKKFYAQCSVGGRVFENFQKNRKISKFQKRPKWFPKESKRVLIVIWDNFSEKILPSVPWRVESAENFKKTQGNFKIPKTPKIVPKSIQTCFEQVLGQTFRKFLPTFPWKVESSKISKKKNFELPKTPTIVPKSIQTCFEHVLGKFY